MLGRLPGCVRACVAEVGKRDAKSGVTMRFDYVTVAGCVLGSRWGKACFGFKGCVGGVVPMESGGGTGAGGGRVSPSFCRVGVVVVVVVVVVVSKGAGARRRAAEST
jgi:hypothetical protein